MSVKPCNHYIQHANDYQLSSHSGFFRVIPSFAFFLSLQQISHRFHVSMQTHHRSSACTHTLIHMHLYLHAFCACACKCVCVLPGRCVVECQEAALGIFAYKEEQVWFIQLTYLLTYLRCFSHSLSFSFSFSPSLSPSISFSIPFLSPSPLSHRMKSNTSLLCPELIIIPTAFRHFHTATLRFKFSSF